MDKPWKVILAFMGIFLAGTISGVIIAPKVFREYIEQQWSKKGPPMRPPISQQTPQLFRRVTQQLDLTADQREKIKPIESRTIEELRNARRESQRRTEQVIEKMQAEVAATLTPEQRVKYDELVVKERERVRKFIQEQEQRGRGGRPGDRRERREVPPQDATPSK